MPGAGCDGAEMEGGGNLGHKALFELCDVFDDYRIGSRFGLWFELLHDLVNDAFKQPRHRAGWHAGITPQHQHTTIRRRSSTMIPTTHTKGAWLVSHFHQAGGTSTSCITCSRTGSFGGFEASFLT